MRSLEGRAGSAQVDTGSGAALGSVPPGPPRPQPASPRGVDGALDRYQRARVCGAAERGRAEAQGGKLPSPLRVPVSISPCRRGRTHQAQALLTQPLQGGARRENSWPGGEAGQTVRAWLSLVYCPLSCALPASCQSPSAPPTPSGTQTTCRATPHCRYRRRAGSKTRRRPRPDADDTGAPLPRESSWLWRPPL